MKILIYTVIAICIFDIGFVAGAAWRSIHEKDEI